MAVESSVGRGRMWLDGIRCVPNWRVYAGGDGTLQLGTEQEST